MLDYVRERVRDILLFSREARLSEQGCAIMRRACVRAVPYIFNL